MQTRGSGKRPAKIMKCGRLTCPKGWVVRPVECVAYSECFNCACGGMMKGILSSAANTTGLAGFARAAQISQGVPP